MVVQNFGSQAQLFRPCKFFSHGGVGTRALRSHRCPHHNACRAELKVTHLRWRCGFLRKSAVFCENLRFSVKICGFLRFPAPSKCWNFQEKGWICENMRFSAKICVLGSLCHLSSVPLSAPRACFQGQQRLSKAFSPGRPPEWPPYVRSEVRPETSSLHCLFVPAT